MVLVGGQLDRPVPQLAGSVDGPVERTDPPLGLLDGGAYRFGVAQVGGDDRDLGPQRLELGETPDAPARRVVIAVTSEPLGAGDAVGHGPTGRR